MKENRLKQIVEMDKEKHLAKILKISLAFNPTFNKHSIYQRELLIEI